MVFRWGTLYDYGYRALLGFAMEKLLCATGVNDLTDAQIYAVLSQRLALDIDTPKYVSTPRNDVITREKLGEIMHDQIKFHMRICVSAEDGLDSLRGIALSEPILSRAACAIMEGGRLKFNLPVALGRAMSGFCLNRYARTRLFVAALFIWARDQDEPVKKRTDYLTVKELFEILFCDPIFESILEDMPSLCPQKVTPRPFREVFGEANMHFNHFIKPYEQEVLTRRCLVRFMARGAAGFSANEEAGFNAVYPYLYGGIDLDVKKIGFIMVQFKNDSNGEEYDMMIFKEMDPFKCGLLDESDKQDGRFPIPLIRIFFSFSCSGDAGSMVRKTYECGSGSNGEALFTSYDYVCSGISEYIFRAVEEGLGDWQVLLKKTVNIRDDLKGFIEMSGEPDILSSYFPASGSLGGNDIL
ncbi:hypothetical protein B0F90DRAFT_1820517 [Multifurca ochricompacta]|uniref:Uncharacterized protein n=1 Tax=Multifurca ochricompacta TaxID=376703 RepID=A0AAD4QIX1_9AGAM|nr:hypothetical protein B0F90DRAFT_1825394 [Multifurca ochricompacta]KAI0295435.1 hypothetical protein B0F90DRAFT_1820517 [Multifurca ochricompacta]